MAISVDELVRLIDVAKGVADKYSEGTVMGDNIASFRTKADNWTEIFGRAYKAMKATVIEEEEGD